MRKNLEAGPLREAVRCLRCSGRRPGRRAFPFLLRLELLWVRDIEPLYYTTMDNVTLVLREG